MCADFLTALVRHEESLYCSTGDMESSIIESIAGTCSSFVFHAADWDHWLSDSVTSEERNSARDFRQLNLRWTMCQLCWGSTASAKLLALEPLEKSKVRFCLVVFCYRWSVFCWFRQPLIRHIFTPLSVAHHIITGQKVAVKILNKGKIKHQEMAEKVRREINILKMCTHPHIIRL